MTPAPKHALTPWGYCYDGSSDWSIGPSSDPQGEEVCSVWDINDERAIANIKFIVLACNNHDKLLEALKAAQWGLQLAKFSTEDSYEANEINSALEQITAALAAVEGE